MERIERVVSSPETEVEIGYFGGYIEQVWLISPNLNIVTMALNYQEPG
jgi:hypothetical protein